MFSWDNCLHRFKNTLSLKLRLLRTTSNITSLPRAPCVQTWPCAPGPPSMTTYLCTVMMDRQWWRRGSLCFFVPAVFVFCWGWREGFGVWMGCFFGKRASKTHLLRSHFSPPEKTSGKVPEVQLDQENKKLAEGECFAEKRIKAQKDFNYCHVFFCANVFSYPFAFQHRFIPLLPPRMRSRWQRRSHVRLRSQRICVSLRFWSFLEEVAFDIFAWLICWFDFDLICLFFSSLLG